MHRRNPAKSNVEHFQPKDSKQRQPQAQTQTQTTQQHQLATSMSWQRPKDVQGNFMIAPASFYPLFVRPGQPELHVRCYLPPKHVTPIARLFFHRGAGGGLDDLKIAAVYFEPLAQKGIAVIANDPRNFGRSQGTPRGTVANYQDFVDDFTCLASSYDCGRQDINALPFFLGGESMGGAVSFLAGLKFQQALLDSRHAAVGGCVLNPKLFRGVVAQAPALKLPAAPPACCVSIIKCCCCCCTLTIPTGKLDMSLLSPHPDDADFFDWIVKPKTGGNGVDPGLYPLTFPAAFAIIDMAQELSKSLRGIRFPFLVMQDPQDKVVGDSKQRWLNETATLAPDKKYVEFKGLAMHILMFAYPDSCVANSVEWISQRASIPFSAHISHQPTATTTTTTTTTKPPPPTTTMYGSV